MTDFHLIHVYLCGHFDSEAIPGAISPEYVFVDAPCSAYLCTHTSPAWFREQGILPPTKVIRKLDAYSAELTDLRNSARRFAYELADEDPDFAAYMSTLGFPNFTDIVFAGDAKAHVDATFRIAPIRTLLRYARQFAKSHKKRVFFDFCMGELDYLLDEAATAEAMLKRAINASEEAQTEPDAEVREYYCRSRPWADRSYQPRFGREELHTLQSAGDAGKEILSQPMTKGTQHIAALFLRTLAADPVPRPPPCSHPPRDAPVLIVEAAKKAKPAAPVVTTDYASFVAWIDGQEAEFVREMRTASARRGKRMVRKCLVRNLPWVGTKMDRVVQARLPLVAACA